MSSSVNKSSSHTFPPTTSTRRHAPRQQLYINRVYIMWSLLQGVFPALSVRLMRNQPSGHGKLLPEVTQCAQTPPQPLAPARPAPRVQRASSPVPRPTAFCCGSVVLPALPSQLAAWEHSGTQGVCAECGTQGRPSPEPPPAPSCCPNSPCWPRRQNFL